MTVIGNSSNLIWSEMYTSITGNDMPFFAPLAACLACMVAGLVAIQLFRDRLTDHLNSEELADTFRDYCVELIVPSDSPLWGKTLSEAGIFAGEDFYLVKIQAFDNVSSSQASSTPSAASSKSGSWWSRTTLIPSPASSRSSPRITRWQPSRPRAI